jgi:integrase
MAIETMTRIKLKYVHEFIDRHGHARFYFRRAGKRVPLPGLPGSTEFMDAYEAALNRAAPVIIGANRTTPGTVEEAVTRYLGSAAFVEPAPLTQAKRRRYLERLRTQHGEKRLRKLQPEHVARLLGKLKPHIQRDYLKALRNLVTFALAEGLIDTDPTAGVKLVPLKDTGGFATWPVQAIEQYREHHELGTRARLALELLYGTMAARCDVVTLGRQHIQGGVLSFRRSKTTVAVDIPILPELQTAIDVMPKAEHLTFLVSESGKPFSPAYFGRWFREQCKLAGLSNLAAHGLRKAGATRLAEAGATDHQIMAWGGWKTLQEVQRYTRAANRKRLAFAAAEKLKAGTEVATLSPRIGNPGKKT